MKIYINDRKIFAIVFAVIAIFSAFESAAQKFAVKAHVNVGLGSALNLKSSLPDVSKKSYGNEYGVDFGYRFWEKNRNTLELNVGLGYSSVSTKLSLQNLDYNYSAPASADMDDETYIRYYELKNVCQKAQMNHFSIPVYLSYGYRCTDWLGIHADLGLRFGFKTSSKVSESTGESFSYGIYPQYDDLMIDAQYLNDFGSREIGSMTTVIPEGSSFSTSLLVGIGAEFKLYGPLSADLGVRYENGFTNLYKSKTATGGNFTSETAPLTYTVADGSQMKSLTDYLTTSKLSHLSIGISLICRF